MDKVKVAKFVSSSKVSMALSKIRDIDSKFKEIVFDYIQQHERKNKPLTIPMMIKYLCLQYYLIQEYFNSHPKSQMIMKNSTTEQGYLRILGNQNVIDIKDTSILKYKWVFKLLTATGKSFIGLESTTRQIERVKGLSSKYKYWLTMIGTEGYECYWLPSTGSIKIKPKTGDMIEMILDVKECELGFKINNSIYYKITSKTVEMHRWKGGSKWMEEMRLKLSLCLSVGQSIEMVSFSVEHK